MKNIWWGIQIRSSLFFSLLHSLVVSSLLGPSILLSTLLSYTLSLCFSLSVRDHVPCPGKIIVLYILIVIFMDSKLVKNILHWLIASIPCIQLCCYFSLILFLGTFAKLRKATIASSYLSISMEYLSSHWTDFCEILYLNIFLKSVTKIQVSLKSDSGYFTWRFDNMSLSSS